MNDPRPIRVLLADDDEDDVFLTQRALSSEKVRLDMDVVGDGVECLAFLRGEGEYAGKLRPDLLLLDINMPRMNGLEVLEAIRKDPDLRTLPVVILTTSSQDKDIMSAYENMCSCYIVKPVRFDAFKEVVKQIEAFWLSVVTLPPPK